MSQWVHSPENLTESPEREPQPGLIEGEDKTPPPAGVGSKGPDRQPKAPAHLPWWAQAVPFFLSAFFFLNGLFATLPQLPLVFQVLFSLSALSVVFAPLPLLHVYASRGRAWGLFAIFTNMMIVGVVRGPVAAAFYTILVVVLSLTLSECLSRRRSIEFSGMFALLMMIASAVTFLVAFSLVFHFDPILEVKNQIASVVDQVGKTVPVNSELVNPSELDEFKHELMIKIPGMIAVFWLVLIWVNLTLLIRFNPNRIRERLGLELDYLKRWKAPDYLVWPTIVVGFFMVLNVGWVSDISTNVFNFIMAIYALQGLSILSYFFDLWGVRGPFRLVSYFLSLTLMTPLILSLGFFDLWFDFRGKFRQS